MTKKSKNNQYQQAKLQNKETGNGAKQINTLPLYVLIILLFAVYIYFQRSSLLSLIFGTALFLLIIALIVLEIFNITKENKTNIKKDIVEVIIAIFAVVLLYFGLRIILQTNSPLNVVPSCSMLPVLQRGDLVVLSGNMKNIKAPIINISSKSFSNLLNNITNEFLVCQSYNSTLRSFTQYFSPGDKAVLSKFNPMTNTYSIVQNQNNSLIEYNCGIKNIKFANNTIKQVAYTTSVKINNTIINTDRNNTIIVYKTIPNDSFYKLGDLFIVHRIFAVLNVSNKYYYLTKGDNNPGLDMQYGNYPINSTSIEGKVIAVIPYLGYLKLVLSNNIVQPYGCNFTTIHTPSFGLN